MPFEKRGGVYIKWKRSGDRLALYGNNLNKKIQSSYIFSVLR